MSSFLKYTSHLTTKYICNIIDSKIEIHECVGKIFHWKALLFLQLAIINWWEFKEKKNILNLCCRFIFFLSCVSWPKVISIHIFKKSNILHLASVSFHCSLCCFYWPFRFLGLKENAEHITYTQKSSKRQYPFTLIY